MNFERKFGRQGFLLSVYDPGKGLRFIVKQTFTILVFSLIEFVFPFPSRPFLSLLSSLFLLFFLLLFSLSLTECVDPFNPHHGRSV